MAGAGAPPEAAAKGEAGAVPGTPEDGEPLDTPRPAESERSVGGPVSDERRAEAVQQRPEAERSASRPALLLLLLAAATAAACGAAGLAVHAQLGEGARIVTGELLRGENERTVSPLQAVLLQLL